MKLTVPLWLGHLFLVGLFLFLSFLFAGVAWNFLPFLPVLALGIWRSPRPIGHILRLLPSGALKDRGVLRIVRALFFLSLGLGGWIFVAAFIGTGVQVLRPLPQEYAGFFEEVLTKLPLITAVLVVGVGAPIFEELLCRGLIAGDLLEEYSPVVALSFSALVFGFLHFNPWQGIPAFFTGIVLGVVYSRSKALLYPIWGHGIYNLGILGLSRLDFDGASYSQPTLQDLAFTGPGALLGLGIFLFGTRRFLRAVTDPKENLLLEGLEKNGL